SCLFCNESASTEIYTLSLHDDLPILVVPGRLEMLCATGAKEPWHFGFAGFETTWRGPIELEVSGSGGYETHDVMSCAALSLDYGDRKSTRLNSSHVKISYAVFCMKKK